MLLTCARSSIQQISPEEGQLEHVAEVCRLIGVSVRCADDERESEDVGARRNTEQHQRDGRTSDNRSTFHEAFTARHTPMVARGQRNDRTP